jgi:hypothetical protein
MFHVKTNREQNRVEAAFSPHDFARGGFSFSRGLRAAATAQRLRLALGGLRHYVGSNIAFGVL